MANADAFNAGFGKKKDDALKGKKPGERSGLFTKEPEDEKAAATSFPKSFKKGGRVKKTGMAKVHKGEIVLTVAQAKHVKMRSKKSGARKRATVKR